MKMWIQIVLLTFLVTSCDYFRAPKEPKAIARVGKSYLYLEDIANLVPSGTSKKDSIAIVKSFIDRWATQKLLFEGSVFARAGVPEQTGVLETPSNSSAPISGAEPVPI